MPATISLSLALPEQSVILFRWGCISQFSETHSSSQTLRPCHKPCHNHGLSGLPKNEDSSLDRSLHMRIANFTSLEVFCKQSVLLYMISNFILFIMESLSRLFVRTDDAVNYGSAHSSIPTSSMISHDHFLIWMLTSDHQAHINRQAPCHVT